MDYKAHFPVANCSHYLRAKYRLNRKHIYSQKPLKFRYLPSKDCKSMDELKQEGKIHCLTDKYAIGALVFHSTFSEIEAIYKSITYSQMKVPQEKQHKDKHSDLYTGFAFATLSTLYDDIANQYDIDIAKSYEAYVRDRTPSLVDMEPKNVKISYSSNTAKVIGITYGDKNDKHTLILKESEKEELTQLLYYVYCFINHFSPERASNIFGEIRHCAAYSKQVFMDDDAVKIMSEYIKKTECKHYKPIYQALIEVYNDNNGIYVRGIMEFLPCGSWKQFKRISFEKLMKKFEKEEDKYRRIDVPLAMAHGSYIGYCRIWKSMESDTNDNNNNDAQ